MKDLYAEIAVELPIDSAFTYSVPEELKDSAALGKRALVPFGKRTVTGYILGLTGSAPKDVEAKPIIDVIDELPIFDEQRLKFYKWVSRYYFAPLGSVLALTHPAGSNIKSSRKVRLTDKGSLLLPQSAGYEKDLLEAAKNGASVSSLLKKYRNRPVHSLLNRLKKKGLVEEEVLLLGGSRQKTERFVAPVGGDEEYAGLKRSPIQAKVFKYLLDNGERPVAEIRCALGEVGPIIAKLAEKGLVEVSEKRVLRDPLSDIAPRTLEHEPNPEQKTAIDGIVGAMRSGGYSPFLLYGVTGSGKTLVYLKVLEEAIKAGKGAVFLAPEIALTPWPAAYLAGKFPGKVAIAHSGLSPGERADEWERILKGDVDVVVGARSALFSPVKDLGLIIVDEEHETSYKQEDGVRYNARDSALMLASHLGITVVLGSATPSVETFYNANSGKVRPLYLRNRVSGRELPRIEVADMRGKKGQALSERLKELMASGLADGKQSLLFLNRRGFSQFIICKDCGHTYTCLNCSVSLTMHKARGVLRCHYCDLSMDLPERCAKCGGASLVQPGTGTERVEEEMRALFPKARVGRMDRDTTQRKGSAKRILDAVEQKKIDILVGTQMVSKGHHFPGITLVGVISGDTSLNIPDFRSSERTFQLITQAAGRAGRGEDPGEVVIQTLNPEHYCFMCAEKHDYDSFYAQEIAIREELDYPPFSRLCCLRLEGPKEYQVIKASAILKAAAGRAAGKADNKIAFLGPAPALLARVKNRYRWQMLVKGHDVKTLHRFVSDLKRSFSEKAPQGVQLCVDMDPSMTV